MGKRGRKPTTGCFETREKLVDKIGFLFTHTRCSIDQIARHCEVSAGTVNKIINTELAARAAERITNESDEAGH